MNQKTSKLIRKAINKTFAYRKNATEESIRKEYQISKKRWNSTPKNERWFSRIVLKNIIAQDENNKEAINKINQFNSNLIQTIK